MPSCPRHCHARLNPTTRTLAAVVFSMLSLSTARAQDAATGVVTGSATDPTGAALAGARVVATRTATASVRETTTDSAGRYVLASLAPGEYRVSIEAPGFASKTLDRVVVEVGRRVPVDAVLDVGGRAEAVTVEERAVPVRHGQLAGGRRRLVGGRREPPPERPELPRARLPPARQRPRAELRPDEVEQPSPSPPPASSAAAATSRSTGRTTTTTWSAGRSPTCRRTRSRSSRSRRTASRPSRAARRPPP